MKLKLEIWSDVACPFCYIGKRHLEQALSDFEFKDEVEIEWKSFQLDPSLPDAPEGDLFESLAQRKNLTMNDVLEMTSHVEKMALNSGLNFNLKKSQPVNTFKAHQLLQLAKQQGVGYQVKEALLKAYFIDGENIADQLVLDRIGQENGLDYAHANKNELKQLVENDIYEAQTLEISGVPFFLFEDKYAISGAQPVAAFSNVLNQVFAIKLEEINKAKS